MSTTSARNLLGFIRRGELGDDAPAGALFWAWLKVFLGLAGLVFGLTILFLGMRGVMELGGFVASGGPYAIAHPAPDWVWIMPVSIFGGVFFIFLYFSGAKKIGGINLLIAMWSILFLSLGYNFMEYGFNPPEGMSKPAWGWLIPWVLFWIMGGVPVLIWIAGLFKRLFRGKAGGGSTAGGGGAARAFALTITHIAAVAIAIYAAILIFRNLSS